MGGNNTALHRAKAAKNDEFYTRLEDIEKELAHYGPFLQGKTVYCPCDNPKFSMFYRYFKTNFSTLGLKKLICTHIEDGPSSACIIEREREREREIIVPLNGNGDFRSAECIDYLDQCDIVITNPPFSLFREFFKLLAGHGKQFIIVGTLPSLKFNECWPSTYSNKIRVGVTSVQWFDCPDGQEYRIGYARWITSLNPAKEHGLVLTETYSPEKYPKYDTYDAIEVSRVKNIPNDYQGVMGVPLTYLDKHDPSVFEIVGKLDSGAWSKEYAILNGKELFTRILIRRIVEK